MIDWDDAFDNTGYISDADAIRGQWSIAADQMRQSLLADDRAQIDVPYGTGPREIYDFFQPSTKAKGTFIFVHGGYWHLLDKSYWSHLANGFLEHGWAVALPSYPLAPEARISDITAAIARAVSKVAETTEGPIAIAGHSAGGHLVSRMACEGVLPTSITDRITQIVSISGVFHLSPLLETKMNDTLRLDAGEAAQESPVELEPFPNAAITFWVGDQERPEFLRQTRMMTERWADKAVSVRSVYETGTHHLNVIDTLQDPNGALVQELLRNDRGV